MSLLGAGALAVVEAMSTLALFLGVGPFPWIALWFWSRIAKRERISKAVLARRMGEACLAAGLLPGLAWTLPLRPLGAVLIAWGSEGEEEPRILPPGLGPALLLSLMAAPDFSMASWAMALSAGLAVVRGSASAESAACLAAGFCGVPGGVVLAWLSFRLRRWGGPWLALSGALFLALLLSQGSPMPALWTLGALAWSKGLMENPAKKKGWADSVLAIYLSLAGLELWWLRDAWREGLWSASLPLALGFGALGPLLTVVSLRTRSRREAFAGSVSSRWGVPRWPVLPRLFRLPRFLPSGQGFLTAAWWLPLLLLVAACL